MRTLRHTAQLASWSAPQASLRRRRWVIKASEEKSKSFVVGKIARRTLLVSFKCNICEGRTDRLVNPLAWNKGTVFVQCQKCENWHRIKDNLNLIDEIRYKEEESNDMEPPKQE